MKEKKTIIYWWLSSKGEFIEQNILELTEQLDKT